MITPKVNPEIWERLDRQRRGKDLKLSALQTTLAKVGNITAQTIDMLLKSRAEGIQLDVESIIRMNTDALALLGHISFEISQRRRDVIRPTLNKDYSTLCASHVAITTMCTSTFANKRPYNNKKLSKLKPARDAHSHSCHTTKLM